LARWPGEAATAVAELLVSPRGLVAVFLAGAAVLATAGWLRPPLSPDIRGVYLPLGIWKCEGATVESILVGPRRPTPDSAGCVLLSLVAAGAVLVLWKPERLGVVAGVLMATAIAANAAAAFNHPALIERMDHEYEQRRQIAGMSAESPESNPMSPEENPLASPFNGRIGLAGAPVADEQRGDLVRGWVYLLYGIWLIPWCGVGVILGSGGTARRRWTLAGLWVLLGTALAGAACARRLTAEYHWARAQVLETRCEYAAARRELRAAVDGCPEMEQLERTWLLTGKLDHLDRRRTTQQRFFHAFQLARDRSRPRAVAYQQDLPWLIARTFDYREGLVTPPSGWDHTLPAGIADVGTRDTRAGHFIDGLTTPDALIYQAYWYANFWEPRRAAHLMEELLAQGDGRYPAVRHQAARISTNAGLTYYLRGTIPTDDGLVYVEQDRRLTTAEEAWRRAAEVDPTRADCGFYLGMVRARADRSRPERVQAEFASLLAASADRALRADILNVLGDAFFEAGQLAEARRRYVESFDVYNLPSVDKINYRAQRRLGGL
jgi:hypothetical protein